MKNIVKKILFALYLPVLMLACTEEDTPPAVSNDFASIGSGYSESGGDKTVVIPFRNVSKAYTLTDLKLSGDATEGDDYQVIGVSKDGIEIKFINDDEAEKVETLQITIIDPVSSTGNFTHTVTLVSDDLGFLDIKLLWTANVDLDAYSLYFDEAIDDWKVVSFSDPGNTLAKIDWTAADGMYGFSYNYYAGADDAVDFSSVFTPTGVKLNGASAVLTFNATYTLANVDPNSFQIEQTCMKAGTKFTEFTDIEVPEVGSRIGSSNREELLVKMRNAIQRYKAEHGK